ncbi:MAG: acyltransferase [Nitrospirae bacterium]|nr:acyltransferase [Nitrospirota bacterium]
MWRVMVESLCRQIKKYGFFRCLSLFWAHVFCPRIRSLLYRIFYKFSYLGANVSIGKNVSLHAPNMSIGDNVTIAENCVFDGIGGTVTIGSHTSIANNTTIMAIKEITIGRKCFIAPRCFFVDFNHIFSDRNLYIKDQYDYGEEQRTAKSIIIEDDCWLGANVIVLKGVTIGRGSVVGAGSLVTKSIPPFSVAAGVPAKIKYTR